MAIQNTDLKEAKKDAIMTPDMYRSMFLRQFTSQCSQSYDKMMAMGFMYTIQKPPAKDLSQRRRLLCGARSPYRVL